MGTQCGEHEAGNGKTGASEVGVHRQIRVAIRRRDAERNKVAKCVSHASRKAAIVYTYPYRKPTQVDEERILRPTGEALLRNSAK